MNFILTLKEQKSEGNFFLIFKQILLIMSFETEGMKEMAERYYPFLHSLAWTYFPTNNSTEGREKSISNEANQCYFSGNSDATYYIKEVLCHFD